MPGIRTKPQFPDLGALGEIAERNPSHIWIEPTNRCNTRCRHCEHFYERFGDDMSPELYQKIHESALDGVIHADLIGYGEPLMAKQFERMFDDCTARGIQIHSTTNGILLRKDHWAEKFARNDVILSVSVDGARKETFEFVRPYIKWERMLEALDCLKRHADAAGAGKKIKLKFNFVAMKQNIADLPGMVRLARDYGAFAIYVLPLGGEEQFAEVNGESLHDSPELVSPHYLAALELAAQYGINLSVPPAFHPLILQGAERGRGMKGRFMRGWRKARMIRIALRKHGLGSLAERWFDGAGPRAKAGVSYCTRPWNDTYFAADGSVFPCCQRIEKLGDMNTQTWPEIWNSQAYRNLRRTMHSWNPTQLCRNCSLSEGINGGDERQYEKFFASYRRVDLLLDDPRVKLGPGFSYLEYGESGAPHHVWMEPHGTLTLARQPGAKFLRLMIIARQPVNEVNPGRCQINGGNWEPFDNTCPSITFPLGNLRDSVLNITLEMENKYRVAGDIRDLSLGVYKFQFLL